MLSAFSLHDGFTNSQVLASIHLAVTGVDRQNECFPDNNPCAPGGSDTIV